MSNDNLITEQFRQFDSDHDGKAWRLKGIFASTRPNANGRTYPRAVLESAIAKYNNEHVRTGTAWGCLDHPDNAQVTLRNAAVLITSLEWIGDEVWGEATVLSTQQGQELQRILEAGGAVGMSTRGTGGVDSKGNVSSDYKLIGIDVVARASAHSARQVEAIYEHELEEAAPYNTATNVRDSLGERLRRIKLRNRKGVNTNPRLKDKDGENHSPSARTHSPSRRGAQGMKQEAQMRLAKGSRYIDPKDDNKRDSANRNPYRPKIRPRFLKPSGSKVKLESELVENLLQAVTETLQDGEIFEAAMALGEHYLAECNTSSARMPKTVTQNNLTHSNTSPSGVAAIKGAVKAVNKAHGAGVKAQKDLKREAVESAVWNRVYGGGAGRPHNQKEENN